ncbi:hypothetical protein Y032_0019g3780 [Ancylostoma ceylanicum]|uniref:Uncharacterized protein n=1 Tax=Ancylostoma ceylanicum TaxID=53326 RepID=A0A016V290_9BILA|nr:hypothetical protein Y032_0019g3780 [Ancylostoma ceylanicum]
MKRFATALCVALFCVGLPESAPSPSSLVGKAADADEKLEFIAEETKGRMKRAVKKGKKDTNNVKRAIHTGCVRLTRLRLYDEE